MNPMNPIRADGSQQASFASNSAEQVSKGVSHFVNNIEQHHKLMAAIDAYEQQNGLLYKACAAIATFLARFSFTQPVAHSMLHLLDGHKKMKFYELSKEEKGSFNFDSALSSIRELRKLRVDQSPEKLRKSSLHEMTKKMMEDIDKNHKDRPERQAYHLKLDLDRRLNALINNNMLSAEVIEDLKKFKEDLSTTPYSLQDYQGFEQTIKEFEQDMTERMNKNEKDQ